jgi:hypothetical protein
VFLEERLRKGDKDARAPSGMQIWQRAVRAKILERTAMAMQTRWAYDDLANTFAVMHGAYRKVSTMCRHCRTRRVNI